MPTMEPVQIIERDRRRRRWVIRFALLGLLLIVLVGLFLAILLRSSPLTLDELREKLRALPQHSTLADVERMLGKPTHIDVKDEPVTYYWQFQYQTWDAMDVVIVKMHRTSEKSLVFHTMMEMRMEGNDAWRYRWDQLMRLLRIR